MAVEVEGQVRGQPYWLMVAAGAEGKLCGWARLVDWQFWRRLRLKCKVG